MNLDEYKIETKANLDAYIFEVNGHIIKLLMSILIAVIVSIIPILLNNDIAIFFTSLPFYITIVVMFMCIIFFKYWGIVIGCLSFILCGLILRLELFDLLVNTVVNTIQLFFLLLGCRLTHSKRLANVNKYTKGVFYLSTYNFALIVIILAYFFSYTIFPENIILSVRLFAIATFVATVLKIFIPNNKQGVDIRLLLYMLFIALLPSAVCSVVSAKLSSVPNEIIYDYITLWTCSNFILLQTIGYIIYQYTFNVADVMKSNIISRFTKVSVGTAFYYIAIIIWNTLIISLYANHVFTSNYFLYFFPWLLGNVLFGTNLIFSTRSYERNICSNKFDWYEKRVITVENNTSTIITIITFLLPLSFSFMGTIPNELKTMFIANVFAASISIGLVWVPNNNVRFIALLQDIKTIFYLYAISLLLLSSMMIIFCQ